MTASECPSCHATEGRPHTEYCRATVLDLAVTEANRAYWQVFASAQLIGMNDAEAEEAIAMRAALDAGLPVLLDAVTVQAREHVAAGRGHMTWAETLTQLRRMTQTTTEESPT